MLDEMKAPIYTRKNNNVPKINAVPRRKIVAINSHIQSSKKSIRGIRRK